jgi:Holliday junction resolvase RusA-like endonuclease
MASPPSLNALWIRVPGKARVRSSAYNAWRAVAGWEVRMQIVGMAPLACRYNLDIEVPVSRRDTGNWEKAISDLLELVGVVTNDGNAYSIAVTPVQRSDVRVAITPLPDMGGIRAPARVAFRPGRVRPKVRKGCITSRMMLGMGR